MAGIRNFVNPESPTPAPYEAPAAPVGVFEDVQAGAQNTTGSSRTVTFPRAFARAPEMVEVNCYTVPGTFMWTRITSITPSGFTYVVEQYNLTITGFVTANWTAALVGAQ